MTAYANVNGETVIEGVLYVPNVGPWWAEVTFEGAPDLSGAVTFNLGELALSGTIDPNHDGVFGEQRRSRIVAGGGGWGTLVAPQHYHNDAGVRALGVAQDAARLAGETLDEANFNPASDSVGVDYVRESGPASRALEDVIGAAPWHVAYNGQTVVGERPSSEADVDSYSVLDFNPRENLATLAIDDLSAVLPGSIITAESSRTMAWGGGSSAGRGRLAGILRELVAHVVGARLAFKYRYRVVQMSAERVELQAVSSAAGLPDVIPVRQKPGVAGAHAKLAGGSIVIVEFIEGDRTLPVVTAYAGKGEEGDAPDELDFSVATTLRLGSEAAGEGATLGDSHKSWADGHIHGYIDSVGAAATATPGVTSSPIVAPYVPASPVPDPAPDTSSKVFVE
jgi:hypothetical protein